MYKWIILILLCLALSIWGLIYSCVGVLAPFLISELNFSSTQVGFLVSAVAIGYAMMMVPAGIGADLIGVRIPLTLGVLIMGVLIYTVTKYSSFSHQFVLFVLIGVAGGLTLPTTSKSVMDWFDREGRATAMGIKQSGINMGGMVAGILLPYLAVRFNWQFSLKITAFMSAVSGIIIFLVYREYRHGMPNYSESSLIKIKDSIYLIFDRKFLLLSTVCFLMLLVQFGFTTYLVLFLTRKLKFDAILAGKYLFASFAAGILGRVGFGLISDFLLKGMRPTILLFMAITMTVVCFLLGVLSEYDSPTWVIFTLVLVFGLTGMGWNGMFLTIIVESAKKELSGTASGFSSIIGFIGVVIWTPIFGYILDTKESFYIAWNFLTLCAFCAVCILIFLKRLENI